MDIHLSQKQKRNDLDTSTSVRKKYRSVASCYNEEIGSGRSTIPSVLECGHQANVCGSNIYDSNKAFTPQQAVNFPNTSADISVPEQPAILNPRRQSTRNRAPTARALEALVNGDLTESSGRRRKD